MTTQDDAERAEFEAVMANHGYENSGWCLPIPVRCPAGYKPLEYVVGWAMWQAGRAALRAELKDTSPEGGR